MEKGVSILRRNSNPTFADDPILTKCLVQSIFLISLINDCQKEFIFDPSLAKQVIVSKILRRYGDTI